MSDVAGDSPGSGRTALLWLTTQQLRALRLAAETRTPYALAHADGLQFLTPKPADVEWALELTSDLDNGQQAEQKGDFGQALEIYEGALQKTGRSDYILMRIGSCHAKLGALRRALVYLEKAATLSPNNPDIRRAIAACLREFPEG